MSDDLYDAVVYRVTYNGPSDTRGARFTVRNLRRQAETRGRVVPFDYAAGNAREAAVRAVVGDDVTIQYGGEDARHTYYIVNPGR